MRRLALHCVVFFILLLASASAQWQWAHPLPQGNTLMAVQFSPDGTVCWAVGEKGTILKSTDAGVSWTRQALTSDLHFQTLSVPERDVAWALSYSSFDTRTGLMTINSGATWQPVTLPDTTYRITALSADEAWTFTGYPYALFHTTNRGTDWVRTPFEAGMTFTCMTFSGRLHGWIGGWQGQGAGGSIPAVYRTSDAGASWNVCPLPTELTSRSTMVSEMCFIDATRGWISVPDTSTFNEFMLYATSDGGSTWSFLSNIRGFDLKFVDATHGFAMTDFGDIIRSTDGGITWEVSITNPTAQWWNDADYTAGGLVLVGGNHMRDIFHSSDFATLQSALTGFEWSVMNDIAARGRIVCAVGDRVMVSSNGGGAWTTPSSIPTHGVLASVQCLDATTIVAAGPAGTALKSTDAGMNWSHLPVDPAWDYFDQSFVSPSTGVLLGWGTDAATLARTTDGGATWMHTPLDITAEPACVYMVTSETGFLGCSGGIRRTTDGGATWSVVADRTDASIRDFAFDGQRGWAAGDGVVLSTTDGGSTWSMVDVMPPALLNRILLIGPDTLLAAVSEYAGRLVRSTDGGRTWSDEWIPLRDEVVGLTGSATGVWLCGREGGILHRSGSTLAAPAPPAAPVGFTMAVSPNPVTSTARIHVDTAPGAASGAASLQVCDITGRVIADLTAQLRAALASTHSPTITVSASALPVGRHQLRLITPLGTTSAPLIVVR